MWKIYRRYTSASATVYFTDMIRCVVVAVLIVVVHCNTGYDYYWRDYDGSIPADAVSAAYGLYVGQYVHKCNLVPGSIYAENRTFVGEFSGKFEARADIKILCASDYHLKWVNVKNVDDGIPEEEGCKLVRGGHQYGDPNFRWFIGRIFHEGMWKVSKADFDYSHFQALSVWKMSGGLERVKKFEVLKACKNRDQCF